MNSQAVTLLLGYNLAVCAPIVVQPGVRPPQDREAKLTHASGSVQRWIATSTKP